jgi:hypothetical protein
MQNELFLAQLVNFCVAQIINYILVHPVSKRLYYNNLYVTFCFAHVPDDGNPAWSTQWQGVKEVSLETIQAARLHSSSVTSAKNGSFS